MSTNERIARLLDLPALIDAVGKRLTAQRGELRSLERRIKLREAEVRLDTDLSGLSGEKAREARVTVAQGNDAKLAGYYERLESLRVSIDKYTQEREALDHERKALKAALEREYAQILERVLTDDMLARRVTGGRALS